MEFSVSAQYAHQEHSESVHEGKMSSTAVLRFFDNFDWASQVSEASRLNKVSPTLSVEDTTNDRLIWVSGYEDSQKILFVSECTFKVPKTFFFGLINWQGVFRLNTQDFLEEAARNALEFFMKNDETALRDLYSQR